MWTEQSQLPRSFWTFRSCAPRVLHPVLQAADEGPALRLFQMWQASY